MRRLWPVRRFQLLLFTGDLLCVILGWALGLWLRFDGAVPLQFREAWRGLVLPVGLLHVIGYLAVGFYRRVWKYAGPKDMFLLALGQALVTGAVWALIYFVYQVPYPRGAVLLAAMVTLFLIGGSRLLVRLGASGEPLFRRGKGQRVLVVGAGEAGRLVVGEFRRHPELGVPVAFADDDRSKQGMLVAGLPVLADRTNLEQVVVDRHIDQIIMAIPSASRRAISEWVQVCTRTRARVRILPGVYEILKGQVDLSALRDVRPEDLLGREPAVIDLNGAAAYLGGHAVLVTGAGGSIGSELCRQIIRFGPRLLLLLGNEENQVHDLAAELNLESARTPVEIVLADIRDQARINEAFMRYRPDLVFHAAAHKHVPLLELHPGEAVKNNVFGTLNVAQAALKAGAKSFVYVSSDKAVRPCSVMGATKRVGEMIVQSLNGMGETTFVAVRFGNVLGSSGSVLPLFQRQVARGGPVTVTDPDATRFFMTAEEACQLLIQAAAMGRAGQVMILDMGTPVKIVDLAENVIRLAGKHPGRDVHISFIGLRPGEKVHEELLTAYEEVSATKHENIFMAPQEGPPWPVLTEAVEMLRHDVDTGNHESLLERLFDLTGIEGRQMEASQS